MGKNFAIPLTKYDIWGVVIVTSGLLIYRFAWPVLEYLKGKLCGSKELHEPETKRITTPPRSPRSSIRTQNDLFDGSREESIPVIPLGLPVDPFPLGTPPARILTLDRPLNY